MFKREDEMWFLPLLFGLGLIFWGRKAYATPTTTYSTNPPSNLDPNVARWWNYIVKYATQFGVDPKLIATIITIESRGDPNTRGSSGEIGLMQVLPSTATGLGYNWQLLYNPEWNIYIGTDYFSRLYRDYGGDIYKAFYAYNAGKFPRTGSAHQRASSYASNAVTIYYSLV